MGFIWKAALVAVALYALVIASAYLFQKRLIYFPETARISPASVNLPDVEELTMSTPDGEKVLAWYGRAKPGYPTLLYFHGNAGSFEFRQERIRRYMARGYGMFVMTYRGYGGSTGTPSERANVADALLAYDTLVGQGVKPDDIIVYGESLGTGIAVQLVTEKPVGALILDAPYTSLVDVAEVIHPWLPSRWLMTDRYDTMKYIGRVKVPLLVMQGELDEVVPISMGKAVFAAANEPKTLKTFPGAGHSDHWNFGSYEAAYAWLDDWRAAHNQSSANASESRQ